MDFQHPEGRQMLADTIGRYLHQRYAIDARLTVTASETGWSRDHWRAFAEIGIIGALFGEEAGGFGGSAFDIGVVFEQLGRRLVVEPFLDTLMAGRILTKVPGQEALVAEIIAGQTIIAFAHQEADRPHDINAVTTRAEVDQQGWRLTGRKAIVAHVESADHILVSANITGDDDDNRQIGLFLVERHASGLDVQGYALIDGGRAGELSLNATPAVLVASEAGCLLEEAIATGIVALSWEAVGLMEVLRDHTIEYLRTRKQFGVAIGKFQALQHRMANIAIEIEQARSAAINAANMLDGDRMDRERMISAAKYTVGRVGTLVAEEAIQMHGGIGMTWELPLSHYAKRLIMLGHQLGDEDHHLARFIELSSAA